MTCVCVLVENVDAFIEAFGGQFEEKTTAMRYLYHTTTLRDKIFLHVFRITRLFDVSIASQTASIVEEFQPKLVFFAGMMANVGCADGELLVAANLAGNTVFNRSTMENILSMRDRFAKNADLITLPQTKEEQELALTSFVAKGGADGVKGFNLRSVAQSVGLLTDSDYKTLLDDLYARDMIKSDQTRRVIVLGERGKQFTTEILPPTSLPRPSYSFCDIFGSQSTNIAGRKIIVNDCAYAFLDTVCTLVQQNKTKMFCIPIALIGNTNGEKITEYMTRLCAVFVENMWSEELKAF